jgi:hypothetical protein
MKYIEEWQKVQLKFRNERPLGLDPKDEPNRELYEHMIYWLGKLYMDADWAKIARSKNVYRDNVFEHVVKASSSQPNVRRVNDRICEDLGLQSIRVPSIVMDFLEMNRRVVLRSLRLEPIYFCLKAGELAGILWDEIKKEKKKDEVKNDTRNANTNEN